MRRSSWARAASGSARPKAGPNQGSDPPGQTRSCGRLLERRVEEPEPPAEVLLDRQLALELRLQLQLLRVVSLLVLPGGDERPEGTPLVAVDEVDRILAAVELEDRREQLLAEALLLETLR